MAGGFDFGGLYREISDVFMNLMTNHLAAILTRNGKDFQAIRGIRVFELVVL